MEHLPRVTAVTTLISLLCLLAGLALPGVIDGSTPPSVSVRSYGAVGNGTHDDTAALNRAMRAMAPSGGTVRLPRGTYKVSSIRVPDGVRLVGAGMNASWIRGGVSYGSRVRLTDLKIGARGRTFYNAPGARYSTFTRCRFRGGGDGYVVLLGDIDRSCSYITFKDCLIECNLGKANWNHSNPVNNIRITENAAPGGAHVDHVTFDGCHVGVSNGVRKGSPRAGLEAYTWDSTGTVTHGWSNLRIVDCVFEAADEFTIDLADTYRLGNGAVRSGPALIKGCTIKGGGKASDAQWGYSICIEAPVGVVVEDNTIYRASSNTIGTAPDTRPGVAGPIFRNNRIDLTYPNGIASRAPYIYLRGQHPQFVDNRVIAARGTIFKIERTDGVVVTGNDVTAGSATVWQVWDATVTNATLAPNAVR